MHWFRSDFLWCRFRENVTWQGDALTLPLSFSYSLFPRLLVSRPAANSHWLLRTFSTLLLFFVFLKKNGIVFGLLILCNAFVNYRLTRILIKFSRRIFLYASIKIVCEYKHAVSKSCTCTVRTWVFLLTKCLCSWGLYSYRVLDIPYTKPLKFHVQEMATFTPGLIHFAPNLNRFLNTPDQ